jgi:hypothetical protein
MVGHNPVFCHRYSFASLRTGSIAACGVRKTVPVAQATRALTGCEACETKYPTSEGTATDLGGEVATASTEAVRGQDGVVWLT